MGRTCKNSRQKVTRAQTRTTKLKHSIRSIKIWRTSTQDIMPIYFTLPLSPSGITLHRGKTHSPVPYICSGESRSRIICNQTEIHNKDMQLHSGKKKEKKQPDGGFGDRR